MKKTTLLISALILLGGSMLCSCSNQKENIPALLERKKNMGPDDEKVTILTSYKKAAEALKKDPEDLKQYITLAAAFISEGRITGDNTYYSNAAVKMLDKITASGTADKDILFQALSLKSAVQLNMHQFRDALETAGQGEALNSFNAGIYGALTDAYVELGMYDSAVKECDKMISIRPDLRSYSRASYLRQIFGQNRGAVEAMNMAVQAGMPGAENTEWARTRLADLYLGMGNTDSAAILYRTSLVYRPGYAYSLIGLARVEQSKKNYDAAIAFTRQAISSLSEAAFVAQLADLYELKGDAAKAKDTREDVVRLLEEAQEEEPKDAELKHNVSRELATAYMNAGHLNKAMEYAQKDLAMRPANIDANELAAWICYLKKDYARAKMYAAKMLATHTMNAGTLYKAGLIYSGAGELAQGTSYLRDALATNPNIDELLIRHSRPAMALTTRP